MPYSHNKAPRQGRTNSTRPPTGDGISVRQGNYGEFSDTVESDPEPGWDQVTGMKPTGPDLGSRRS